RDADRRARGSALLRNPRITDRSLGALVLLRAHQDVQGRVPQLAVAVPSPSSPETLSPPTTLAGPHHPAPSASGIPDTSLSRSHYLRPARPRARPRTGCAPAPARLGASLRTPCGHRRPA